MSECKRDNYECPRCGYSTNQKTNITYHLYKVKHVCPASKFDIELTDEIKEYIIKNRIYRPSQNNQTPTVTNNTNNINNIINNYNVLNNFITKLDPIEKLTQFTNYKKIEIQGLEEVIEDKYAKMVRKLDNNSYKYGYELKTNDLFDTIDEVSKVCNLKTFEEFNILYDSRFNKLKLYDGEWSEMLINSGVKRLIETIQSYYWNSYESYLLRKIFSSNSSHEVVRCRELLDEYFKFIGCFDVTPFFKNKDNNEILRKDDDSEQSFTIDDEYGSRYAKICGNITKSEINQVKKSVIDIVKKNTLKNIDELNKRVAELFHIDEKFKQLILTSFNFCQGDLQA